MPWVAEPLRRRLSLRWLLTCAYGALIAVCLAALGSLIYFGLARFLWFSGERELYSQLFQLAPPEMGGRRPPAVPLVQAGPNLLAWSQQTVRRVAEPGLLVRVVDPAGQVLAAGPFPRRLSHLSLPEPREGVFLWQDGRRPWQLLAVPVNQGGQQVATLWVGRPWRPSQELLTALSAQLMLGSLLVLGAAGLLSFALARMLSRPLEKVAATAHAMAAGDLQARTGLGGGRNEIYQLAGAFDAMGERVQQAFETQAQFVADASHELKTPLTAISGMVEVLRMGADQGVALNSIERETDRMTRLVADLLTLSRAQQGLAPKLQAVEVGTMLGEAVTRVREAWPEHRLEASGQGRALADPDLLLRVIAKLLDNALKYTPPGGSVRLGCSSGVDGKVEITVQDTGVGISKEDLPRVFDRFYRADPSRSRATGGTGLGLAIVQSLVARQNGTIVLESEPGRGTVARLRLPAA